MSSSSRSWSLLRKSSVSRSRRVLYWASRKALLSAILALCFATNAKCSSCFLSASQVLVNWACRCAARCAWYSWTWAASLSVTKRILRWARWSSLFVRSARAALLSASCASRSARNARASSTTSLSISSDPTPTPMSTTAAVARALSARGSLRSTTSLIAFGATLTSRAFCSCKRLSKLSSSLKA